MKVFVAGATGAIGAPLVALLAAHGDEVAGLTRSEAKAGRLRELGAEPVVGDALDSGSMRAAVAGFGPDVVVHQLTALAGGISGRRPDKAFALTNRLRTEGTENLIAAAREAGARRIVAQSYAGWPFAREGGPVKDEDAPLDPDPPNGMRVTHAAIRRLEEAVTGADGLEGVVLRYGGFYGPGTFYAPGGEVVEMIRKRRFPVVGDGGGIWSFIHVDDAARATLAAVEGDARGIFNVVDDDPAPVSEWVPELARIVGAKRPLRVPAWIARLAAGEGPTAMMTEIRGASNAKARRELGWTPAYPSWREGLRGELAA